MDVNDPQLDRLARLGRGLGDPTRVRILLAIAAGTHYPGHIAEKLNLTRPNVSNHLSVLLACGLVRSEPEDRRIRYSVDSAQLTAAGQELIRVAQRSVD